MDRKVAAVTGANRGLGWGTAQELARRGFRTILLGRKIEALLQRKREIEEAGGEALAFELDVAKDLAATEFSSWLAQNGNRIDVLVNCAGVLLDGQGDAHGGKSAFDVGATVVRETFETNTLGPYRLCQAVIPFMKQQGYGRIVNVSSGMGGLEDMGGMYPAYRISKTALNAVTRVFSAELANSQIKINSVCPGWVRTDMGGQGADRSVEEGISGIIWAATLPHDGPSGGFFRDGKAIAW